MGASKDILNLTCNYLGLVRKKKRFGLDVKKQTEVVIMSVGPEYARGQRFYYRKVYELTKKFTN